MSFFVHNILVLIQLWHKLTLNLISWTKTGFLQYFPFCWEILSGDSFFVLRHSIFLISLLCVFLLLINTSDYIKRLRYCEYLGRYFCQCCHENTQAVVPSRVLRKWDFSKYYVSNFARDLLSKIAGDPLFNPSDINSGLYKKIKALETVRVSRPNSQMGNSAFCKYPLC